MQWSLHIRGPEDLAEAPMLDSLAALETSAKLRPAVALALDLIRREFGEIRFDRCAFGTEFCENLIPGTGVLEAAVAAARARGLGFTLLTPYVGNAGIAKLRTLFMTLERSGGGEVVFNDWGTLNVLRREFPLLTPLQGRLLNKALRDPRVTGLYGESSPENPTLVVLQRSSLDCGSYTDLLARMGVKAVEMDNLPQGADLSFADRGIAVTVYIPFGFISTSRACMAAGLHYRKPDKFQPGADCRHECQTHLLEYTYTNSPFDNRDQRFWLKGNTYFYTHTEPMLRRLFQQARGGRIARLVVQPRLPMLANEALEARAS